MASSSTNDHYPSGTKVVVLLVCFLLCLSSITEGIQQQYKKSIIGEVKKRRREMMGSRPPRCVNKCFSCRPCMATLVIQPPEKGVVAASVWVSEHEGGDSYYLLTWKCKCGNKLFQP